MIRQRRTLPNANATRRGALSTGAQLIGGAKTLVAGAAAAAIAVRLGATATEGLEIRVIDEIVSISPSGASFDLIEDVPAGSVILSVQGNLQSNIAATTAVKVGIGITANPDKYGLTSGLSQNDKIDTIPDWAVLSSAEDIKVFACDTNGAAAGVLGTVGNAARVRIVYIVPNSLDNA